MRKFLLGIAATVVATIVFAEPTGPQPRVDPGMDRLYGELAVNRQRTEKENKRFFDMAAQFAPKCKQGKVHGFFIGAGSPRPWIMGAPDISEQMKLLDKISTSNDQQANALLAKAPLLCNSAYSDTDRYCMGVAYTEEISAVPWAMSWAVYKEYGEKAKNYSAFIAKIELANGIKGDYLIMAKKESFSCEQLSSR